MLTIHKIENLPTLNVIRKKTNKTKILLYDTNRRLDDFIMKLKYRRNGEYDDIPHFVISKFGEIYEIFNTEYYSNTFNDKLNDMRFIKIAIENLGWLNKNTINGLYFNWIGDPYRIDPFNKNWRNFFFWDKYPEIQMKSVSNLCEFLCEKHNIKKSIVPSQGYYENAMKINGVVCKSNFSDIYTDINPSFNFNLFFKNDEK
jgi:hypothetical protein